MNGLDSIHLSLWLGLDGNHFFVAGTDAVGAGQRMCKGYTKAVICRQVDSAASSRDVCGCSHH